MQLEGTTIGSRYRLEAKIGEGGMGGVFRAHDETLQRLVAVKVLFAGDERDREARVGRFLREARLAAAVQHRNVVQIVDFGTTDEGRPYMVMEYLEGETLGARLARSPALSLAELFDIASGTLGGLAVAHDKGIVHRDMKPENVFLVDDQDGAFPKILDFGISRSLEPRSGPQSAFTTKEGFLVGTPQYMSPEQARGLKNVDHRTDIYSIGAVLYEALTGRLPFESDHMGDLIILIASGNSKLVSERRPEVGETLSELVDRAMRVDRAARFADAREMREALAEVRRTLPHDVLSLGTRARPRPSKAPPGAEDPTARGRGAPDAASQDSSASQQGAQAEPVSARDALAATLRAATPEPDLTPPAVADAIGRGEPSVTTPNAWTVGEDPPRQRRRGAGWYIAGTVILLGATAIAANRTELFDAELFGGAEHDRTTEATAGRSRSASSADDRRPLSADEGPSTDGDPTDEVTLTLEGVPEGAEVLVDDETMPGPIVTLARSDAPRRISVHANGLQWEQVIVPAEDLAIEVNLTSEAPATEATADAPLANDPAENNPQPSPNTRVRPRPVSMMSSPAESTTPPPTLRDLDY